MEYKDKTKSKEERKALFKKEVIDVMMNPNGEFDPDFDHMADDTDEYELGKRERKHPPKKFKTLGIKPKEIMEGQMIGMYESKQDLYLMFANRCNELQDQIDLLNEEIIKLKK